MLIPKLYVKSQGEQTTKLALTLTQAPRRFALRLTGGCGLMSPTSAAGLYELFAEALAGYDGIMLYGGTRMLGRDDPSRVIAGITEIPWELRRVCPRMVALGVIPRTDHLQLSDHGLVVNDQPERPYLTIVHPHQDVVLLVQVSPDQPAIWDAEFRECLDLISDLRAFAGFRSALVCYNGGQVSEREVRATAELGWPVILINGSGRASDRLTADRRFLKDSPGVRVVGLQASELRQALEEAGALEAAVSTEVQGNG